MRLNQLLRFKFFIIVIHVSIWAILFILPVLLRQNGPLPGNLVNHKLPDWEHFRFMSIVLNLSFVPLFYLNAYVFFPRYWNKKNWPVYMLFVAISVALIAGLNVVVRHVLFRDNPLPFPVTIILFLSTFILISSTAYSYIQENSRAENSRKEKEEENLKAELSFLRSQLSPHFLFNTLNNLVSLARKKSDLLEPSLLKLSGLLQYMLYTSDDETISLQEEAEYLNNYIELQKLRFGNDVRIINQAQVPDDCLLEIMPMMLIPFVENAFKHGVVYIQDPEILIRLETQGQYLCFEVKNKYNPSPEEKDKSSGIGLNNVKRRLNLLYPDAKLLVTQDDCWHVVNLSLLL
jgi:two-component system, LytTR family, sensor kinase